jgi:pimeloyl-ACP methyl ester carboxylesterase
MKHLLLGSGLVVVVVVVVAAGIMASEQKGLIELSLQGETLHKRYVLRYPENVERWNRRLVIGAHGGTGGDRFDLSGKVIGTDETALDDVVGDYAVEKGFAYASVDRDGYGATPEGLALTYAFTEKMQARVREAFEQDVTHTYLVGLSMGGGITRHAAEDPEKVYDGTLLIAGGAGDLPTGLERQAELAVLWPEVDPKTHPDLDDGDGKVRAYAEAVGTPVAARAYWPFIGAGASLENLKNSLKQYGLAGLSDEQLRSFDIDEHRNNKNFQDAIRKANTTGRILVPTIEVVGSFDDFVLREIRAYEKKVEQASTTDRHRLYIVEGVWHISDDDDAIESFAYIAKRRRLGQNTQNAMLSGASYLPAVWEAFMHLDRWVTEKTPPPPNQEVLPGQALRP